MHTLRLDIDDYPMDTLPDFAIGNFYVLSRNAVEFIAANIFTFLRPLGILEDVSVALWLMAIQVYPVHLPGVLSLHDLENIPLTRNPFGKIGLSLDDNVALRNTVSNTSHPCCLCSRAGQYNDSFPIIAVHSVREGIQFDKLNALEKLSITTRRNLVNSHSECDITCLEEAMTDLIIASMMP